MPYQYPVITRVLQRCYRLLYRNKTSAPFLSQDFFKSISDLVITHSDFTKIQGTLDLKQAKVIYCQSDLLTQFLEAQLKHQKAPLIFSGGSDTTIDLNLQPLLPPDLHRIYIQNSLISDNQRIFTLPIGLEDLRMGLNGVTSNLKFSSDKRCNNVMVGPFSPTHPDRETLLGMNHSSEELCVYPKQLSPRENAKASSRHSLIACPRGGGLDTHRVWETLYRGSIPILQNSAWAKSLSYLELPILLTHAWSSEELKRVKKKPLELEHASHFPSLWAPYWQEEKMRIINL